MKKLQKALLKSPYTVACAESCTGGLVAKLLTDLPGSSRVFAGGFVTYCNETKKSFVGVREETLQAHYAVSRETAMEMALGALEKADSDVAVSTTGVAGPGGDDYGNPVGRVYIGYSDATATLSREFTFSGDREAVRTQAAEEALKLILERN
jgi:nicotinamide-nucleotide amidase